MGTPAIVEKFQTEHRQILDHLAACEPLTGQVSQLAEKLKQLRPLLLAHLEAKDGFYVQLKQLCSENGDLASANIATIFSENMNVQSGAVRKFLAALETPSALLSQSFTTMALIIRNRLSTEERAVFPLYLKNLKH